MPASLHPEPRPRSAARKLVGGRFLGLGELVVAAQPGKPGHVAPAAIDVALDLDERDRALGERAVADADRVGRVLPALVDEAAFGLALVLDEAVAVEVAVVVDPVERRERVGPQLVDQLIVSRPALVLIEQHQPQRRGVDRAVVGRVRDLVGACQLARAQLVQDLARLCVAPVVDLGRLEARQERAGVARDLRPDRQQLEAVMIESRPNRLLNQGTPAAT